MLTFWKRVGALLLAAVMLLPLAVAASAEENRTQNADIVLVMDDTGSMTWNDPHELARVAIEQFGVQTPFENSNIGVVTFSTEVIAKFPMTVMDETSQTALGQFADTALTRAGLYTDLSVGLAEAVRMLQGVADSDNSKAIIAVTDGANDFGAGRTEAMSAKDLADVERIAQEMGIQIHLVAINSDEDVVAAYLNGIASVTGGSVTFVETADGVSNAIKTIYTGMGLLTEDSDASADIHVGQDGATVVRSVPENVFEVLFNLQHGSPIELTIQDSNGRELYPANPDGDVSASVSDTETVVKVREPAAGEYTLFIKNMRVAEQDVTLSIYRNSEVQVVVDCPAESKPGEDFTISAQLVRGGQLYTGVDLQNLTAAATLTKGSQVIEVPLAMGADNFSGTARLAEEGDWTVVVEIRSDKSFSRTNDQEITIRVSETAAAAQGDESVNWLLIALIIAAVLAIAVVALKVLGFRKAPMPMCSLEVRCSRHGMDIWSMIVSPGHALGRGKKGATLLELVNEENRLTGRAQLEEGDKELFSRLTLSAELKQGPAYFVWTLRHEDGGTSQNQLRPNGTVYIELNDPNHTVVIVEWRAF
nr:vWA domain-containing protein [uncultured Oscillibacter sp.]